MSDLDLDAVPQPELLGTGPPMIAALLAAAALIGCGTAAVPEVARTAAPPEVARTATPPGLVRPPEEVLRIPEAWRPLHIPRTSRVQRLILHKVNARWQPGNEALLIEDKATIKQVMDLLRNNHLLHHYSGGGWALVFRPRPDGPGSHIHNMTCEWYRRDNVAIHRWMRRYTNRAEQTPTHWIYIVTAKVWVSTATLQTALVLGGDLLLTDSVELARLPFVEVGVEAGQKDRPKSHMDVRNNYPALARVARRRVEDGTTAWRIHASFRGLGLLQYSRGNSMFLARLHFARGFDLDSLEKPVGGVKIIRRTIPDTYTVHWLSRRKLDRAALAAIIKRQAFIERIEEYNKWPVAPAP